MKNTENKGGNEAIASLPPSTESAIELKNITKRFGHVVANSDVNLKVRTGTIHGIVGENGAGKSTLMNILFGLYKPDSGMIFLNGQAVDVNSPEKSIALGIGMVHQHFMLVPTFTVLENAMLGNEGSMLLRSGEEVVLDRLKGLSNNYGLDVDFEAIISDTPVGMQQRVEILKALSLGIFATGSCPVRSNKENRGTLGQPIEIGGILVKEGSWIYADESGVLVSEIKLEDF